MILKGLKRRSNQIFLKKNYDSFSQNSLRKAPKVINTALFIFDDSSELEEILKSFSHVLEIKSEDFTYVLFSEENALKQNDPWHLTDKDFGWNGKLKEGFLKEVLTKKYDLLINNCKVENLYTDLLVLQVKAGLKVGLGSLKRTHYDLLIQCDTSNTALITSELKKYLEILK